MQRKTRVCGNTRIDVDFGLRWLKGNQRPYFSLTMTEYEKSGNKWRDVACGAAHERILEWFPEFADLAALHLSTDAGVPMHAVENGWYWLGKTKWEPLNAKHVARHFRIDEAVAPSLAAFSDKSKLAAWVEAQKPIWKAEAEAAIAKHGLVVPTSPE